MRPRVSIMKSAKLQPALSAPPKRGRGRPRKTFTVTELEDINPDSNEVKSARNLKDQLNAKELKFIEIYMLGGVTKEKAMELAGYTGYHQRWVYYLAAKIIQKYESRTDDRRKLFRAVGAGELAIARGLLDLAQKARSEQVRRAAWADLASCMGLKSEQIESFQGVTLNVYSQAEAQRLGIQVEGAASRQPAEPQHIQITK